MTLNPIRFSGLNLSADDLAVENGALAVCAGVEPKDGYLRPSVLAGSVVGNLYITGTGPATLLYVHDTGSYSHFLAYYTDSGTVKLASFYRKDEGGIDCRNAAGDIIGLTPSFDVTSLKDIDSVGNTVVMTDSEGLIHYLLWHDGNYEELPQKPPMLDLRFRLGYNSMAEYPLDNLVSEDDFPAGTWGGLRDVGANVEECFSLEGESSSYEGFYLRVKVNDDYKTNLQNAAYALFNECNAVVSKAGHFYAPFFIRYCYRMFDGSFFMHSAPVYLPTVMPATAPVNLLNIGYKHAGGSYFCQFVSPTVHEGVSFKQTVIDTDHAVFYYAPVNCALEYEMFADSSFLDEINKWKDVIKSVDIFITPPETDLTTDRTIDSYTHFFDDYLKMCGGKREVYKYGDFSHLNSLTGSCRAEIPVLSVTEYFDKMRKESVFYRLKSIDIDELPNLASTSTWRELEVDSDVVRNIETQKVMTDDYKTHNLLRAEGSYAYNHRLNFWGMKEKLFSGFSGLNCATDVDFSDTATYSVKEIRVKVHTESGDRIVSSGSFFNYASTKHYQYLPLFYPDSRAVEMFVIFTSSDTTYYASAKMEEASGLNGAWTVEDIILAADSDHILTDSICPVSEDADLWLDMPSKIYSTKIDNPFYFPLEGINTVGTGTVRCLTSTTRALSQGQFGQYPLMAFASDGIWALEVSDTGSYSSIHPISREVATVVGKKTPGVCQLDQAVVFISSRGANILQQSEVTPLSDALVGISPGMIDSDVPTSQFPEMLDGIDKYFSGSGATALKKLISISESPVNFLQHCQSLNDPTNHRVFFIDTRKSGIALVMSTDTFAFSYMAVPSDLVSYPGYPCPYISYADTSRGNLGNVLVCLDEQYDYLSTDRHLGLILTRALTFTGLYTAISGFRQSHSVRSASDESELPHLYLYGSNDLRSWHFIGHSVASRSSYMPAHSFRYFRIGLLLSLRTSEQYLQTTLGVTDKYSRL